MSLLDNLQRFGIRRLGSPKSGFRYATVEGKRPSVRDRRRIESLKIPPAWKEVRISAFPRASLQAVGKDRAGRWQYLYNAAHVRRREEKNYRKLLNFGDAL